MAFGSSSDGFGQKKQGLGFDAAASERLRINAAMKEKRRIERDRAKMQLADMERKLEHNKTDVSHRLTEVRRLETESMHADTDIKSAEIDLKMLTDKEHSLKAKTSDSGVEVAKLEKQIFDEKKKSDTAGHQIPHLEAQIALLQHQLGEIRKTVYEAGVFIQKVGLQIKQVEGQAHKSTIDALHSKTSHEYKEKDIENKKKAKAALDEKKHRELMEVDRLKADDVKLEHDIKALEDTIKQLA